MAEISPSAVPGDEHFYRYLQAQKSEDAAKFAAMGATKAALEQTAFMTFLIEAADNGTIASWLIRRMPSRSTASQQSQGGYLHVDGENQFNGSRGR